MGIMGIFLIMAMSSAGSRSSTVGPDLGPGSWV